MQIDTSQDAFKIPQKHSIQECLFGDMQRTGVSTEHAEALYGLRNRNNATGATSAHWDGNGVLMAPFGIPIGKISGGRFLSGKHARDVGGFPRIPVASTLTGRQILCSL
jgi:hypothetical protein